MSTSQNKQMNQDNEADELQNHIMSLFGSHLQSFSVGLTAQGVILRGTCDSFYTKQSVQEVVRKNSRLRIVANALVVQESRLDPINELTEGTEHIQ